MLIYFCLTYLKKRMSQFFGCVALKPRVDLGKIKTEMTTAMSFFVPDSQGIFMDEHIFIVQKHLYNSIESHQAPAMCETERYVLAASCRIDNREDLYHKLKLTGDVFGKNSISDHEYILKTYETYQEDCVKHLIGDFSFVVWDKQKEKLFMAKDHLGIKPLFYTIQNENLFFSTDLNAFLSVDEITIKYSKSYVASLLFGSYLQTSVELQHTCYENIYRLKPAYFGIFYTNSLTLTQYWKLQPQKQLKLEN